MKRFFIAASLLLVLNACEEEPTSEPQDTGYPTDNLSLKAEKSPLLLQAYARAEPSQVVYEALRQSVKGSYSSLNTFSIGTADGDIFKLDAGVELLMNYGVSAPAPYALLNDQLLTSPVDMIDLTEDALNNNSRPLVAIGAKLTENDTAWIIDSKVQFLRDTLSNGVRIETYLLADVPSQRNGQHDLRFPDVNGIIKKNDSNSTWQLNIFNVDSTEQVVMDGDLYVHPNVFMAHYNETSVWGTNLSEYWNFGGVYATNDIIGTRYTPIRHYFNKEDIAKKYKFRFEPKFLTVVWVLNPFTFSYEYSNSYLVSAN